MTLASKWLINGVMGVVNLPMKEGEECGVPLGLQEFIFTLKNRFAHRRAV